MTNLDALRESVSYPIPAGKLEKILIDREVEKTAEYSLANKRKIDLATADALVLIATSPNISEGGFTLNITDRAEVRKQASGIYDKYGEDSPFDDIVSTVRPW